jgi:hypothetical protein
VKLAAQDDRDRPHPLPFTIMFGSLRAERRDHAVTIAGARAPADVVGIAVLLILTAIVAWDRLGDGQALLRTDIITQYLPWYSFLGEQLRAFNIPGWNPHNFSGAPFAGDPQSGWMYAPSMLFFTILPPVAAYTTFVVFHLAFGGISTYAFARVLGMRVPASIAAGVVFEFGPFIDYTRCCTIRAQLAVWIPAALLGVELATRTRSPLARLGWWTLSGFAISQMIAGWVGEGMYYGILITGGYILYRTVISPVLSNQGVRDRLLALVVHGAAVMAIGFGLAAAGLLPRLAVVSRSNVAGGDYAGAGSGKGWQLLHMLYRVLNDEGVSTRWYIGGATLALAVIAPLVIGRRFGVPFFTVYAISVFALSLDHTPIHYVFYLLPEFQQLHEHVPNRVLAVLPLSVAILAAATIEGLPRWSRHWRGALAAALPVLIALDIQSKLTENPAWTITWRTMTAIVVTCALLLLAVISSAGPLRRRRPRFSSWIQTAVPILLITVLFWDPTGAWYGNSLRDSQPTPRADEIVATLTARDDPGGAGEFLQAHATNPPVRYFGYNAGLLGSNRTSQSYQGQFRQPQVIPLLVNNRAVLLGLDDIQGYNPVQVKRYVDVINAINGSGQNYHDANILPSGLDSPLLDLLGVRYVVVPDEIPPGRPDLLHLSQRNQTVFAGNGVRVVENASALPRAWIVHQAEQVKSGAGLDALARGAVDPRTTALLEAPPPDLAQPANSAADEVTMERSDPDYLRLRVQTDAAGLLVLSDTYDPGWEAWVDGKKTDVHVADHALRAVAVPAGAHTVELRYNPPSLRLGVAITLATLAALALAAGVILWRGKRLGALEGRTAVRPGG